MNCFVQCGGYALFNVVGDSRGEREERDVRSSLSSAAPATSFTALHSTPNKVVIIAFPDESYVSSSLASRISGLWSHLEGMWDDVIALRLDKEHGILYE